MKNTQNIFKKITILVVIIALTIIIGALFKNNKYKDIDYLVLNQKGELVGFKEYNVTKNKPVEYKKDGTKTKATYDSGDLLITLIQKEHKDVVVIPKKVKKIKKDIFSNIDYINTLKIEMDITKIEDEMFINSKIKNVILSNKIKSIGKRAFMNNLYLKEVKGKIKYIEESGFENCVSLSKIDLKEASMIGENAFKGCNSIKLLYLSKDLEKVGKDAFMYLGNDSIIYVKNSKVENLLINKYSINKTRVIIK